MNRLLTAIGFPIVLAISIGCEKPVPTGPGRDKLPQLTNSQHTNTSTRFLSLTTSSASGTNNDTPVPQTNNLATFETVIRQPPSVRSVHFSAQTGSLHSGELQCNTCHSIRSANATALASDLDEFHQGMTFAHGTLSCASCHNADDHYASLKLADGSRVDFEDSIKLCSQCHGPQLRDYQHGAHGGMSGYWDLTRGPRQRNHCQHCHDPHAPKFQRFQPVAGPLDRFSPVTPLESAHSKLEANASSRENSHE